MIKKVHKTVVSFSLLTLRQLMFKSFFVCVCLLFYSGEGGGESFAQSMFALHRNNDEMLIRLVLFCGESFKSIPHQLKSISEKNLVLILYLDDKKRKWLFSFPRTQIDTWSLCCLSPKSVSSFAQNLEQYEFC